VDWVKGKFYERKLDDEIPRAKELTPEKEVIIRKDRDLRCASTSSGEFKSNKRFQVTEWSLFAASRIEPLSALHNRMLLPSEFRFYQSIRF